MDRGEAIALMGLSGGLESGTEKAIALPKPRMEGPLALERALLERRSLRRCSRARLTLGEAAQLLWAAQGVTSKSGYRTAPSAGALYPLETFLCAGQVDRLGAGAYKYRPDRYDLLRLADGDARRGLADAALGQAWLREAPLTIALAGVFRRTTGRYQQRGIRYAWMEAGHAAQNILLQAAALGLGGVPVGAFDDRCVQRILRMGSEEEPLYLIPVGRK